MLPATFCHLKGLPGGGEGKLWESGILSWSHYSRSPAPPLSSKKAAQVRAQLDASHRALQDLNAAFFLERLLVGGHVQRGAVRFAYHPKVVRASHGHGPSGHYAHATVAGGYGGLKVCERLLGIRRQVPEDMDGFQAVQQWYSHRAGDATALPKLLAYNAQDVLSLELLLIKAHNTCMRGYPLFNPLPPPAQARIAWPD